MRVLVIGGTGVISRAIVSELLDRNDDVTILNRGTSKLTFGRDLEWIVQDKRDDDGFRAALNGRHFDAIIDMISFNKEHARQTIDVCGEATQHLVICSSVAAYKRPYRSVPTSEASEVFWDDPEYGYGYDKAEVEKYVIQAGAERDLPITRVRPGLTFGDGARNIGVLRQNIGILERIRTGKPLVMFGDGLAPCSFSFAPDVARGIAGLLGKEEAFGEAFHVSSEQLAYWQDLYIEIAKSIGKQPRLVYLPSEYLYRALPDLCAHLHFEKSHPNLFNNEKLRSVVPDFSARISLKEGIEAVLDSWKRDGLEVDSQKDALEDHLADTARRFSKELLAQ